MNQRRSSLFWGLALLVVGAFLLLFTTDVIPELSAQTWAVIASLAAVIFLIGYLITGWRRWYFMFPAAVSAAVAAILWMTEQDVADSAAAGLFMAILSVPFWIGYLADSQANRYALIPGWAVASIAVLLLLENQLPGNIFVAAMLLALAFPFLVVFLLDRRQWWALIPAYVLGVLGLIFLILGEDSDLLPVLIMFAIAVPFLVVFLRDRKQWWALIPAGIMTVVGLFLLVTISGNNAAWTPSLIVLGVALPFYAIYLLNRDQWWALLPAGILTGAAVATFVATSNLSEGSTERLAGFAVLISLGLVFAFLWWQRKAFQTDWAGVPALIMIVGAVAILIFGLRMEIFWALAFIALGGWILLRSLRPRMKSG